MAHIIKHLGFVVKEQYGAKNVPENIIMTSGYYVVASKMI